MAGYSLFPHDNPQQSLRIFRAFMAYGFYLVVYLILLFAIWMGFLSVSIYLWFVLITTLIHVIYYAIFRSGLNLRFRDPSITLLQMHVSLVNILVMMYLCDEVRWAFVMMFLVVFLFGIFRLRSRDYLCIGLFAMIGYASMIGLLVYFKPYVNIRHELFQWLVLSGILPFFTLMAGYINGLRRQLEDSLQTIRQMASHDELTGVYNRRFLMEKLDEEKKRVDLMEKLPEEQRRVDRSEEKFCICMLDIDFFKEVNDTHGHLGGDEVLKSFARLAADGLRSTDYLARYGGEEFLLVLPNTGLPGAWHYAERLRSMVEKAELLAGCPTFRITVSIGIAAYFAGESVAQTIDRADQSLYLAKRRGRNRIEMIECG